MREIRTYGSLRGASSNGRPYRNPDAALANCRMGRASSESKRGWRANVGGFAEVQILT